MSLWACATLHMFACVFEAICCTHLGCHSQWLRVCVCKRDIPSCFSVCVCVCVFNTSVTQALLNVKRFRTHRKRQIAFYWPDNITMGWEALCALDPCVCVCMCDSCGWWGICSLLYNLLFYYYASVLLCLCQRCFSVLALKFQNTNTVYILNVLKYIFF